MCNIKIAMSHPPALSLSDEARLKILTFLKKKFSGDNEGVCFFRRFEILLISPNNLLEITNHFGPDVSQTLSSLEDISPDIVKKNIEIRYSKFSGFTSPKPIRDENEEYSDKEIYIHSNNYCQVDLTFDFTFKFNKARQLCSPVTPQHGDLIFIFISNKIPNKIVSKPGKKSLKPKADFWCIVSEQFLHAWTLIQYDWHESFDKLIAMNTPAEKKEASLREKIFSGNRLMTNSWLKYKLAIEDSGEKLTTEESKKRYWHLRTEFASRKWVDIYAAIVLVCRYGELPCPVNVPNSKSVSPIRLSWNLPDIFMTMLLQKSLEKSFILDFIPNYDQWVNYSDTSVMFSFFNNGKIKGFFDDIHTIKLNVDHKCHSDILKNNLTIRPSDFPGKDDIKPLCQTENMNTWASIVLENKIALNVNNERYQNQKIDTFTLKKVNQSLSSNWAEVVITDREDL